MSFLPLFLFILPLGLDTLGVAISLGMKNQRNETTIRERKVRHYPEWLSSAFLFAKAETLMPLIGLLIGYATSLFLSNTMHLWSIDLNSSRLMGTSSRA